MTLNSTFPSFSLQKFHTSSLFYNKNNVFLSVLSQLFPFYVKNYKNPRIAQNLGFKKQGRNKLLKNRGGEETSFFRQNIYPCLNHNAFDNLVGLHFGEILALWDVCCKISGEFLYFWKQVFLAQKGKKSPKMNIFGKNTMATPSPQTMLEILYFENYFDNAPHI